MTPLGYESLKTELKQLTSKDRPAVINAISTAREHGDLKENAEYKAAKEQQQFISTRMAELEHRLGSAQIVEITAGESATVVFGVTVALFNMETEEEKQYTLVGQDEVLLIQVKAVLHCIIIDASCESARLHQFLSG